ncbi:polysaccharide biosynthesis/export family protein [Paraburkholderia terricola]|uniref:Polysaccharide export outer membrane protein n=1 Tax=Paraburkholderia terricola TaxID=169427 RepID=A0ABU1LTV8_9BURK|nr:polysaccharide biosynthesis/export family protein [Paraburkholderia terricola]MDR6410119.1 polysaccharide export outer membrane protein [Paraburkholderia terricola]MDR6481279.1 polysaccharide export outer membrane protein [Paraburkholderia terricola]
MRVDVKAIGKNLRIARGVCIIAACTGLVACAAAPGMKMTAPATLQLTSGDAQTPPASVPVQIEDINVALIAKMQGQLAQARSDQLRDLMSATAAYRLGKGDVLQITLWDHPELAAAQAPSGQTATRASDPVPGFVIDEDGNLQFPYVGSLHVEGLRPAEVQRELTTRLANTFIKPQVTVRVASFRAKQVFVDGQVHTPGALPLNDIPMTLYDAINRAGGFSDTADQSRLVLVRDGRSYPVSLTGMLDTGANPAKIVLRDGDLLRVLARDESGVYVMGEVNKPITAIPLRNGRLTLSEAIAQAGSLNSNTADASEVYVIRNSLGSHPQVYHLAARSPVSMLLANQFEMNPRDIVYVDGNGLVRFSRVLSLLLPAVNAALTGAIVTK